MTLLERALTRSRYLTIRPCGGSRFGIRAALPPYACLGQSPAGNNETCGRSAH